MAEQAPEPPRVPAAPPARWRFLRRLARVLMFSVVAVAAVICGGFAWFIYQVPAEEVALDRNADGIVVLTGGASRIADAIELLAAGHGKRLLISGVHRATTTAEIARINPRYQRLVTCCVDLDHSAVNTVGNAVETRRWVRGARVFLADRGDLGLAHAAHHGGACPPDAGHRAGAVSRGDREAAQRAVVGERADRAADPVRIRQVRGGTVAHADRTDVARRCRQYQGLTSARLAIKPAKSACEGGNGVLILRSVAFNLLFYLNLVLHVIVAIPTYALPRRAFMTVAKSWGHTTNALLVVAGIRIDLRGLQKIPPGALLVASKHQSVWETAALLPLFDDPAYIFKRELMWIPIFGWYAWKSRMIPVDRSSRGGAIAGMIARAREEFARGRQIVIFPEGTRTAPGAPPAYKQGVVHLYADAGVSCLPVALNSGLYWPRRKFLRYPGTIVLEVLDPIPPGLDAQEFAARLTRDIEAATARLIAEASRTARS